MNALTVKYINGLSDKNFGNNSCQNNLSEYAGTGLYIKPIDPYSLSSFLSLDSIIYLNLVYGVKIITLLLKELPCHISVLQS